MKNQKGFGVIAALIVVVVIGVVGLSGWLVWHKNQKSEPSKTATSVKQSSTSEVESSTTSYKIPDGYTIYEDKRSGFKLAYPMEYGSFSPQDNINGVQVIKSSEPESQYGPGINGPFQIFTYPTADQAITSRKYGPQIKMQNGKWIVTEVNAADVIDNKVGDVYRDFEGKTVESQSNDGLAVYVLKSGDEGSEAYRLVFIAHNQLHEVYMPVFNDGLYGGTVPNDKQAFTTLLTNVKDSIFLND